jgi:RNA polymerase sigma factor (sigma-70 family)
MKSFTEAETVLSDVGSSTISHRIAREQQFDRLLGTNGPALRRLAASYTNTPSDRDDLLQEIAIAIWQALPQFRGECSERTFVFRIAHNRSITHLASTRSQMLGSGEEIEVHDPAPNPESMLAQEQRAALLRLAIPRLPVVYRQVITLTLEGLGYGEIAEVLGISESNVGVRLNRARQMLRQSLEDQK